jgi:histidine ammonia-lyase
MALAHGPRRSRARHEVYGFTTGVGALRDVDVDGDLQEHTMRLLRSHAAGSATRAGGGRARDALVRLAQMAAGAAATARRWPTHWRPPCARAAAQAAPARWHRHGDLTVLAQLALALAGEADPRDPAQLPHRLDIQPGDALPFMSSNAATFATAVLAWADLATCSTPAPAWPR